MDKTGETARKRDMTKTLSHYSERPYINKFGSWQKALEIFVDFLNKDEDDYLKNELEVTKTLQTRFNQKI